MTGLPLRICRLGTWGGHLEAEGSWLVQVPIEQEGIEAPQGGWATLLSRTGSPELELGL